MTWHRSRMVAADTESTGVDPTEARIVTACVATIEGRVAQSKTWLINPGIEIPAGATEVHGITTEHAREYGQDPSSAVWEIASALIDAWAAGIPVVFFNAAYDLTLLDHELIRYGYPSLATAGIGPVVDPLVIDRHLDRYRKGSRKLDACCAHYQVKLTDAHTSDGDALAAARVAWRMCEQYPEIAEMPLPELHAAQAGWHAEWAAGFQSYLRKKDPTAVIDGSWPYRPAAAQVAA